MIVAALLPLSLREALVRLPDLTARLEATAAETEQLQIPLFREALRATAKVRPRKSR
jgi:hypothetical protein